MENKGKLFLKAECHVERIELENDHFVTVRVKVYSGWNH